MADIPIDKMNIEVYEYKLKDYPFDLHLDPKSAMSHVEIKTVQLNSSNSNECGIIQTSKSEKVGKGYDFPERSGWQSYDAYQIKNTMTRSCDPINGNIKIVKSDEYPTLIESNNPAKINFTIDGITSIDLINYSNLNGAKKILSDHAFRINKDSTLVKIYNTDYIFPLLDDIKNILKSDWIDNTIEIESAKTIEFERVDNYSYENDKTLIKILKPDIDQKYIIFGDFHGSFHTFLRHLIRFRLLGILNQECILLDNYHLIFLGDLVDRGNFGYEIIILTFLLKKLNPKNVHLNRGNHEELNMNSRNGFKDEIFKKITGSSIVIQNLYYQINTVLFFEHSALLIKNPINKKYAYLAHGGLPLAIMNRQLFLLSIFNDKLYRNPLINYNNNIILDDQKDRKGTLPNSIRWSDFHGKNFSMPGDSRHLIGRDILDKTNKQIEIIIRGHQDGEYNTKLIKNGAKYSEFIDINTLPTYKMDFVNDNVQCYKFMHKITVNDSNEIIVNDKPENNFLKVLTISNNTDVGRDLDRDSYIILKYKGNYNHEIDKCVIKDSEEDIIVKRRRIEFLSSPPPPVSDMVGGYYKKYLKYKQKYLQLKNKI